MQCKLIREMKSATRETLPVGTVITHPQAWWQVRMGTAVPEDDECRQKCAEIGLTPERMTAAQKGYDRANRGIHPDDFEAYEAGWMIGYIKTTKPPKVDALGNTSNVWQPGPNWDAYQARLQQRVDELLSEEDDSDSEAEDDSDGTAD